jgi:hypothetical protein
MCQIAVIDPGKQMPWDELKSSARVNPHGFGIAVVDRGKISLRHVVDPKKDNDPEFIMKLLEEAKDKLVLLHLRYKTKGEIDLNNAHPFWVTQRKDFGEDIVMAHNGTMYQYADEDAPELSDTAIFNRDVCKPLLMRELVVRKHVKTKAEGPILHDKYVREVLVRAVPGSNKVVLLDGNGHMVIINRSAGVDMPWGWAANKYSFNPTHREPATTRTKHDKDWWRKNSSVPPSGGTATPPFLHRTTRVAGGAFKTGSSVVASARDIAPPYWLSEEFVKQVNSARLRMSTIKTMPVPNQELVSALTAKRPSAVTMLGLNEIADLTKLGPDEIEVIKRDSPMVYDAIFLDLLEYMALREFASPLPPEAQKKSLEDTLRVAGGAL